MYNNSNLIKAYIAVTREITPKSKIKERFLSKFYHKCWIYAQFQCNLDFFHYIKYKYNVCECTLRCCTNVQKQTVTDTYLIYNRFRYLPRSDRTLFFILRSSFTTRMTTKCQYWIMLTAIKSILIKNIYYSKFSILYSKFSLLWF